VRKQWIRLLLTRPNSGTSGKQGEWGAVTKKLLSVFSAAAVRKNDLLDKATTQNN